MNLINFIKILILNLLTLTGTETKKSEPVRLAKKPEKKSWLQKNHDTIMMVLMSIVLILSLMMFLLICFMIGGTESGKVYNNGGLL